MCSTSFFHADWVKRSGVINDLSCNGYGDGCSAMCDSKIPALQLILLVCLQRKYDFGTGGRCGVLHVEILLACTDGRECGPDGSSRQFRRRSVSRRLCVYFEPCLGSSNSLRALTPVRALSYSFLVRNLHPPHRFSLQVFIHSKDCPGLPVVQDIGWLAAAQRSQ